MGRKSEFSRDTEKLSDHEIRKILKKKDPEWIVFRCVRVLIIILCACLSVTLGNSLFHYIDERMPVSLIDDTVPVFTGQNGNGRLQEGFHPEYKAIQNLTKRLKTDNTSDLETLIDSIHCKSDMTDHLSNGMEMTYVCTYNVQAAKNSHITLQNDVKEYTVMGLSDYEPVDPFKDIRVEWNEDGSDITITPSDTIKDLPVTYQYTIDKDKVTLYANADTQKMHEEGYEIEPGHYQKEIRMKSHPVSSDKIDKQTLQNTSDALLTRLHNELDNMGWKVSFGKETLTVSDPQFLYYEKNDDGTCQAVFSIQNSYTAGLTKQYYTFRITYQGYFMENEDGTVTFITNDTHLPVFIGHGSYYLMQRQ